MRNTVLSLPFFVSTALKKLGEAGFSAYPVGGCVRDSLLQKAPNDWDITTNARPAETEKVFTDFRVIKTGEKHGTVTVLIEGHPLEITTFRADGDYEDHRHPKKVCFSDRLEDDLVRRDFTVNAMAYDEKSGIVDLFGGQKDLQDGIIRAVGDAETRFEEDGLRILRGLRFASVLGFSVEAETAKAIHKKKDLLRVISAERIREEFCKLICGQNAVEILREYTDVFGVFLPEILPAVGFDQKCKYHCFDVFEHTLHALAEEKTKDLITRLALLFHDLGKPECFSEDENGGHFYGHAEKSREMTEGIMERLKFDRATGDAVAELVGRHMTVLSFEKKSVKRMLAKLPKENFLRLLNLIRCDRLACNPQFATSCEELDKIPSVIAEIEAEDACLSLKKLAVKGEDLMSLGIPVGKRLGECLQTLLDLVLDEKIPNEKTALLDEAKKQFL